jgi:hypothetical protein
LSGRRFETETAMSVISRSRSLSWMAERASLSATSVSVSVVEIATDNKWLVTPSEPYSRPMALTTKASGVARCSAVMLEPACRARPGHRSQVRKADPCGHCLTGQGLSFVGDLRRCRPGKPHPWVPGIKDEWTPEGPVEERGRGTGDRISG